MNIMFRKNFVAEKERSYGKAVGRSRSSKSAGGKRNRDVGYTVMEEHHYRTHIFLSPTGSCLQQSSFNKGQKEGSYGGCQPQQHQYQRQHSSFTEGSVRSEPITLATLDRDCFIIPVDSLDRFLPPGVPMHFSNMQLSQLNVLEVDDPKQCIMIHLMSLMEPIEPLLESPLTKPFVKQRGAASELLAEVGQSKTAVEGMLLSNLEKNAEFPFISFYVVNKSQHDPVEFFRSLRQSTLQKFDPKNLRYIVHHTLDLFNEVATIARPPLQAGSRRPLTKNTGFIISVYKVFEGDDGEKFEKNWLYWTGARMLYRYLPQSVGLRRITLHKSLSSGDKIYLLLCECSHFLEDLSAAALLVPALRGRLCGYTGLYRTAATF